MLGKLRTAASLALAFAVIGAASWALYEIVRIGRDSAILPSFITGLAALGAVLTTRVWERRETEKAARRARIAPLYEEIISNMMDDEREGGDPEFWTQWNKQLLLWGDPEVIHAWIAMRLASAAGPVGRPQVLMWEQFLLTARANIGISNKTLAQGDLLRVYINDWDTSE